MAGRQCRPPAGTFGRGGRSARWLQHCRRAQRGVSNGGSDLAQTIFRLASPNPHGRGGPGARQRKANCCPWRFEGWKTGRPILEPRRAARTAQGRRRRGPCMGGQFDSPDLGPANPPTERFRLLLSPRDYTAAGQRRKALATT